MGQSLPRFEKRFTEASVFTSLLNLNSASNASPVTPIPRAGPRQANEGK